ncbi:MAG TPA: hypothetical protein VFX66_02315, partial [Sulfuricurvum sp.]|nr:hypothetical protein [Sulfuricurvum sp.]
MRLHILGLSVLLAASLLQAEPYTLGSGYQVDPALNIGGYFSSQFEVQGSQKSIIAPDDIAVIGYGDINPMLSYLAEVEAASVYYKNLSNGDENRNLKFHIERLYGDLWLSDAYNIRFGKQITPIGYWNKEPINVLRDSTSSPLYSMLLFPKFLTGIDINGYIPGTEATQYHLFGQNNRDFDQEYMNIRNTHFFGFSVEKELSEDWSGGGSIGEYIPSIGAQRTRYVQVNAKYDDSLWQVMAEGLAAKNEYANTSDYAISGYVQGMYRYTLQHGVIGRVEHFRDYHTHYEDNIAVLGYSYRPWYPVSFKGEYQWHSQKNENR